MSKSFVRRTASAAAFFTSTVVAFGALSSTALAQASTSLVGQVLTVVHTDPSGYVDTRSATVVDGGPAEFAHGGVTHAFYINPENGFVNFDLFGLRGAGGNTGPERLDLVLPAGLMWTLFVKANDSFSSLQTSGGTGWFVLSLNPATPQVASMTIDAYSWRTGVSATAGFEFAVSPVAAVPEPSAAVMSVLGLAGLALARRRQAKAAAAA